MTKVDEILVELRKGVSLSDIRNNPKFTNNSEQLLRLQILAATKVYLSEAEQEVFRLQSLLSNENARLTALQTDIKVSETKYTQLTLTITEAQNKLNILVDGSIEA